MSMTVNEMAAEAHKGAGASGAWESKLSNEMKLATFFDMMRANILDDGAEKTVVGSIFVLMALAFDMGLDVEAKFVEEMKILATDRAEKEKKT